MTIEEIKKELDLLKDRVDALNRSVSVLEEVTTKEADALEEDIKKMIQEV